MHLVAKVRDTHGREPGASGPEAQGQEAFQHFEGIDSERGLEWRCSDSLSLRAFLRLGSRDRVPDHSWLSRSRTRQLIGAGTPREAVAGGYGGIFVLLTPTGAMLVARGVSQSGRTAFAAAFLIWE